MSTTSIPLTDASTCACFPLTILCLPADLYPARRKAICPSLLPAMASEQPTEQPTGGSLGDRVSKPDDSKPSGTLPIDSTRLDSTRRPANSPPDTPNQPAQKESIPQSDGSTADKGGSDLQEPDYTVEVKLSDLQADPNNPLYSVKSFGDLGL